MTDRHDFGRKDGLLPGQEMVLVNKCLAQAPKEASRWNLNAITQDGRTVEEKCIDAVVEGLQSGDVEVKLQAVESVLKMKQQNIVIQRMEMEESSGEEMGGEKVVLILPPNGTEVAR